MLMRSTCLLFPLVGVCKKRENEVWVPVRPGRLCIIQTELKDSVKLSHFIEIVSVGLKKKKNWLNLLFDLISGDS